MRFKAKLSQHQVSVLYSLLSNIARLGERTVTLQLDSKQLRILLQAHDSHEHGIVVYAELDNHGIFLDHKIESQAENNTITMLLDVTQLKLAFRTIVSTTSSTHEKTGNGNGAAQTHTPPMVVVVPTVWKLAKRQNLPCLCLDGLSATNNIQIHQAVPVRLTPDHALSVPHVPNGHDGDGILQLKLPRNTSFKTLLERSKHSASVVYLSGKSTGELVVTMHTDSGAHVQSYFRNLAVTGGPRDKTTTTIVTATPTTTTTTVKVDIRKLTACLHTFPCDICLVENEMLLLHSDTDGGAGRVIYFLPVHYHVPGDHPCDNNE
jgi:Hus1-like protein